MTVVDTRIVQSDLHHPGEVWHITVQQEPRGSPAEETYDGGHLRMDGMSRSRTVTFLRRLADRLSGGDNLSQIGMP